jgi:hypothetical protein
MQTAGTFFDLENTEQGDWFPFFNSRFDMQTGETVYDSPQVGAAEFRIRPLTSFYEERRKDRKKENKMVVNPQTRAMERVSYYPDLSPEEAQAERDDSFDFAITGMQGAFWTADQPIECTRENKIKLMKNAAFSRYFLRVQEMLSNSGAKAKEEAEKNL